MATLITVVWEVAMGMTTMDAMVVMVVAMTTIDCAERQGFTWKA
jgi:hypothetical protein